MTARLASYSRKQRGMATIEFALIAMIMVVMLLGILVYWRAFQAQQSLTRAAGDGARAILGMVTSGINSPCNSTNKATNRDLIQDHVQQTVTQSLKLSLMPGTVADDLIVSDIDWTQACLSGGAASTVSFQLSYKLPSLLGTSSLIGEPKQLSEKSVVHFASML